MLAPAEREDALALCRRGCQCSYDGRVHEGVVLPVRVVEEERERYSAFVWFADTLEGLDQPLGSEKFEEAVDLFRIVKHVSTAKDRQQFCAGHERRETEKDKAALRTVSAPTGSPALLNLKARLQLVKTFGSRGARRTGERSAAR